VIGRSLVHHPQDLSRVGPDDLVAGGPPRILGGGVALQPGGHKALVRAQCARPLQVRLTRVVARGVSWSVLPAPRAAWQPVHISSERPPSTVRNGPASVPQKEHRGPTPLPSDSNLRSTTVAPFLLAVSQRSHLPGAE
jgi:hypothetical protein